MKTRNLFSTVSSYFVLILGLGLTACGNSNDKGSSGGFSGAGCNEACTTYMTCSQEVAKEQNIDLPGWVYDEALNECMVACNDPGDDPEDIATAECALSCDTSSGCSPYLNCLDNCGVDVIVYPEEEDPVEDPEKDPEQDPEENPDPDVLEGCDAICQAGYQCVPDLAKPFYDMEGCMEGCTDPDLDDVPTRDCVINECSNPELTCEDFYLCACTKCGHEDACVDEG